MDFVKLHKDSSGLLERLAGRFPEDQLRMCRDLSEAGEWPELVDLMCAVLVKWKIPVTPEERDALADLLAMFPIPTKDYEYIDNRDDVLAALAVSESS